MKKIFSIIIGFVLILAFFAGCGETETPTNPTTTTTTQSDGANTVSPDKMGTPADKGGVEEFMDLLGGEADLGGLMSGYTLDYEHCYNVTPEQVETQTDMKIFKFSDSCVSLVVVDNEIYPICDFFGGYGFVNAVPCDFDGDGNKDLLVASSWGSGMHRSVISVFNPVTKQSAVIYDTSDTDNPRVDLIVLTGSPSAQLPDDTDPSDVIFYTIYSVNIYVEGGNFADLRYGVTDVVGTVVSENGIPVFKSFGQDA